MMTTINNPQSIADIIPDLPPSQEAIRCRAFHPSGEWTPVHDLNQSPLAYFENNARQHPHQLALIMPDREYRYGELDASANQLAHEILHRFGDQPGAVALLLNRLDQLAIAALAVWKTHKYIAELSPAEPFARLEAMLGDAQAQGLITDIENWEVSQALLITHSRMQLINIDLLPENNTSDKPIVLCPEGNISKLAYTSGSTGQPKGILQTHKQRVHDVAASNEFFHIGHRDRFLYALLGLEFFASIITGATMVAFDLKKQPISELAHCLLKHRVTSARLKPTVFRRMLDSLGADVCFSDLRLLHMVGETIHTQDALLFQRYCARNSIMVGTYGTSETQNCRYFLLAHGQQLQQDRFPAGFAKAGIKLSLIDEDGNEVKVGQTGEIVITTRYLALGYLRQPELTAQKFKALSADENEMAYYTGDLGRLDNEGCLFIIGRKDSRLKIHGNTIEPVEVENALMGMGLFKEVAVVGHIDDQLVNILVAYVVCLQPTPPPANIIREVLSQALPAHMIPTRYEFLPSLPQLSNGKVNRRALTQLSESRPELTMPYLAPRDAIEQALVMIWQNILKVSPIGIHDHFLDLGGDSIRATQVIVRVAQQFDCEISPQTLLAQPTIADMAQVITQQQIKQTDQQTLERWLDEIEQL
ncbi:MAG: non-ribosomal peptide synthetase [Anaerolineae bacterium]|nr:non-ribosomal peptide synthetase [Anaerolineae bacterium]